MPNKKPEHLHIQDIAPRYFPRSTNAREYARDLLRLSGMIRFNNQKIQYSAQICALNIKSINQKKGLHPTRPEVFREIQEFVYHYENYCYRLFIYREKLLQFINAVLPVGYPEKNVRIEHILINPIVKQAGLLPVVSKFHKNTKLSKLVRERKLMTHQLYYKDEFDHYFRPRTEGGFEDLTQFKKWCNDWRKQITSRARITNEAFIVIGDMDREVAEKVVAYRESLRPKKDSTAKTKSTKQKVGKTKSSKEVSTG